MNIHFNDFNESFLQVATDDWGIEQELSEFFSFFADGYKFAPKFRSGQWDGKIRLFDLRNKQLPKGLLKIAVRFCKDRGYTFSMDKSLQPKTGISVDVINAFIDSINIESNGNSITVRDYQREAIIQSISYYRNLLISPTASGKSAILYYKIRWHIAQGHNILLIVPTTQLVSQMVSDFMEYSVGNGFDVGEHCQMLFAGKEKEFTKQVMI
jgi:late competence protein required for DNA uptake (superfamily II DNA/RNA helicase)